MGNGAVLAGARHNPFVSVLLLYLLLMVSTLVLTGIALAARARGWRPPAEPHRLELLTARGAFVAAPAVSLRLLFVPSIATRASFRSVGAGLAAGSAEFAGRLTLLEAGQWAILPVLFVLLALTGAPLLLRHRRQRYWAELGGSVLLAALTIIAGFSVGLFFFPSAVFLFLAVLAGRPATLNDWGNR